MVCLWVCDEPSQQMMKKKWQDIFWPRFRKTRNAGAGDPIDREIEGDSENAGELNREEARDTCTSLLPEEEEDRACPV